MIKKTISILMCFTTIFSLLSTTTLSTKATSDKIKVGNYYIDYGKYVDIDDNATLYLYKNKKCKFSYYFGSKNGTWKSTSIQDYYGDTLQVLKLELKGNYTEFLTTNKNNYLFDEQSTLDLHKAPEKLKAPKLKKGKNHIIVSWNKANWSKNIVRKNQYGVNLLGYGYEIQYSDNKDFKNKKITRVYSKNATSTKIYNLEKNKKYYFKVASFIYVKASLGDNLYHDTHFAYTDFSSTSNIRTPKNCKVTKNLTKEQAKKKVENYFWNNNPSETVKKHSYFDVKKVKFNKKKYYYIEYSWTTSYGTENQRYHLDEFIVSLDNTEIFKVYTDYSADYKTMYIGIS